MILSQKNPFLGPSFWLWIGGLLILLYIASKSGNFYQKEQELLLSVNKRMDHSIENRIDDDLIEKIEYLDRSYEKLVEISQNLVARFDFINRRIEKLEENRKFEDHKNQTLPVDTKEEVDKVPENPNNTKIEDQLTTKKTDLAPFDYTKNHCLNPKNLPNKDTRFVFLKVHKCGSTFTRIILSNFIKKHKIPRKGSNFKFWLSGHPGPYRNDLSNGNGLKDGAILDHFTWNNEEIDKTYEEHMAKTSNIGKKVFKIGIIRQPLSQWISSWDYFNARRGNSSIPCWREPYEQIFSTIDPYKWEKFTKKPYTPKKPNEPFNRKTHLPYAYGRDIKITTAVNLFEDEQYKAFSNAFWGWRQMNMMSFEYGLDWRRPLGDDGNKEIEEVIDQFDLIIVLERLVESLILLKRLLCMEMSDIVVEGVHCGTCHSSANTNFTYEVDETVEYINDLKIIDPENKQPGLNDIVVKKIEDNLIYNDIKLYNAVGRKFNRDVEAFGYENMEKERQRYVELSNQLASTTSPEIEKKKRKRRSTRNKRFYSESQAKADQKSIFNQKIAENMIINGLGYCGHYKEMLGLSPLTDLEVYDSKIDYLRQPWLDEVDFDKLKTSLL